MNNKTDTEPNKMQLIGVTKSRPISRVTISCQGPCSVPVEGVLFTVHPGLQLKSRVLPERRNDQAEQKSDQHKHSRKHDLKDSM